MTDIAGSPLVSIGVATFNASRHVEAALRSALAQTVADIEVIVVDDASSDDTVARVDAIMQRDPRVRLERLTANGGPAVARNRALALARGRWFAILDSDDLFAPDRLEKLIAAAEARGADLIADNLAVFEGDGEIAARSYLPASTKGKWLTLNDYLDGARMFSGGADYGYLKPIIRMERLRAAGIQYDARLRVAEDDDLVVRMLLDGFRYWIAPELTYGYRRHDQSTSHRLSSRNAHAIVASSAALLADTAGHPASARLAARHRRFERAAGFSDLIDALKNRDIAAAVAVAFAQPSALPLLRLPLMARLGRLLCRETRAFTVDPAASLAVRAMFDAIA